MTNNWQVTSISERGNNMSQKILIFWHRLFNKATRRIMMIMRWTTVDVQGKAKKNQKKITTHHTRRWVVVARRNGMLLMLLVLVLVVNMAATKQWCTAWVAAENSVWLKYEKLAFVVAVVVTVLSKLRRPIRCCHLSAVRHIHSRIWHFFACVDDIGKIALWLRFVVTTRRRKWATLKRMTFSYLK